MKYKLINFPIRFGENFKENDIVNFDDDKAIDFFKWFMSEKNKRIIILKEAVNSTNGFENWVADLSVESFIQLEEWFKKVVEKRPTTIEEQETFMESLPEHIRIAEQPPTWTTNHKTDSIIFDAGIYFAETLKNHNPHLKWGQDLKSKTSVDHNYPALITKGFLFNCFTVVGISASKILEGNSPNWKELYEIWDKWAKENQNEQYKH